MVLEGGTGAGEGGRGGERGGAGWALHSIRKFLLNINCLLCIQKHLSKAFLMPYSALLCSEYASL